MKLAPLLLLILIVFSCSVPAQENIDECRSMLAERVQAQCNAIFGREGLEEQLQQCFANVGSQTEKTCQQFFGGDFCSTCMLTCTQNYGPGEIRNECLTMCANHSQCSVESE